MGQNHGTTLHYATPPSRPKPPTSLVVVAVLFILGGASAVFEAIIALLHGSVDLNFGVLGLFIGPGLLRFSRGWRTCALVFTWLGLLGLPIIAVMFLISSLPLDITVVGQKVGNLSKFIGVFAGVTIFALTVWQYRVLTRPDVRRLFKLQ
jgi:hypothetical protein